MGGRLLRLARGVVLVLVDLATEAVLLPIDLILLVIREVSAVGFPVRVNLFVEPAFLGFEVCSFARRQASVLHPVRDAVLLVLFPLLDL
jgi:hypothetical protein